MGEVLYDVMVYPYHFKSKKEAQQKIGLIKNNILNHPKQMTVEDLAKTCVSGQPISFCHAKSTCKKSFTADTWKYQQVYALDFDNADRGHNKFDSPYYMKYSEAIKYAKKQGFSPAFVYTTGSHTDAHHKFRMVFVMDKKVDSVLEHHKVQKAFLALFSIDGVTVLDSSCTDPARVFYSGKKIVYADYGSVASVKELLEKYSMDTYKNLKAVETDHPKLQEMLCIFPAEIQTVIDELNEAQNSRKMTSKSLRSRINTRLDSRKTNSTQITINCHSLSKSNLEFPTKPWYARTCEEFDTFCRQIPFNELLGLPEDEKFNCILPEHEDDTPSAVISKVNGQYIYRCYGCDKTYNIYALLEKISGCGRPAIMDWICKRFNVSYETDWQRYRKEEIQVYHDYLAFDLKKDFPELHKKLSRGSALGLMLLLLDLSRRYILDQQITGTDKAIFAQAASKIAEHAETYGIASSQAVLSKNISYLAHLGLIEVLKDKDVPRYTMQYLEEYRRAHKQRMRTSCYAVPVLTHELLEKAQHIVLSDKMNSVRKGSLCREQLIRAAGEEHAHAVYVQSKDIERNPEVSKFYKRYKAATEKLLAKKGWTVEEEILNRLKGFTKQEKKKWSGVCLPQLLAEANLQRVPFTKAIEEDYHVVQTRSVKLTYGSSRIIIPV